MLEEKQKLEKELSLMETEVERMPPGSFYCKKEGNCYKWFQNYPPNNRHYLKKCYRELAEELARKNLPRAGCSKFAKI